MSAGFPPGFGATPGAPGAAGFGATGTPPGFSAPAAPPGYQQQAPVAVDFVLDIPADPNWQPIETSDVLDNDGFYQVRITSEKARTDDNGKFQVIITLEIQDPDAKGKKIARFMQDPRQTKGDTWWQWRMLMRSIWGSVLGGQQAIQYRPGIFKDRIAYVKTEAYNDDRGQQRTGVGSWSTQEEWTEAYTRGSHRWPAKVRATPAPGVGALPGGTGGLPGAPAAGLPGMAAMPALPGAPAPTVPGVPAPGAAPMQAAPPAQPVYAPPPAATAPPPANPFGAPPAAAPPPAAPPAQSGFGFGPPPAAAAPPAPPSAPIPFPPPAANGVPQPTAAGVAMTFPGTTPPR